MFLCFYVIWITWFGIEFCSTESQENPFVSEGELHKKADYIIRHSTISRTELKIADPDADQNEDGEVAEVEISVQLNETSELQSAPPSFLDNSNHNNNRENGKAKDPVIPVEARVGKTVAQRQEPLKAEEVHVKGKKKCCEIL